MTQTRLDEALHALDSLLEEERLALLNGELLRISELMREKEHLIELLNTESALRSADLDPVQMKLKRNRELFDHALAGVRTVTERLSTLRRLRKTLDTYTADGQRSSIVEPSDNRLEKRA